MPRIKPPMLGPGAVFGVVAPASPLYNRGDLDRAAAALAVHGFRLSPGQHVHDRLGYLAGADATRAADFMRVWCDPAVDAVLCLRGGYGSARMVDRLDFDAIARQPKPFIGFSDITTLHLAIGRRANLVTFYGPMVTTFARPRGAGQVGASSFTMSGFRRALTSPDPLGIVPSDPDDDWVATVVGGVAEGEIVGGCLSLLAGAVGAADQPDWRGKIVFLEDVNEEPYRIDHYLTQLLRAGAFTGVAGIVVAEHVGCGPRAFQPAFPSTLSLEDVVDDLLKPLGVPTIYNLPLGHGTHMATLPLGVPARLDADAGTLAILESGVASG